MKIKKSQLRQIIQEELDLLDEGVMEFFSLGQVKVAKQLVAQMAEWLKPNNYPTTLDDLKARQAFYDRTSERYNNEIKGSAAQEHWDDAGVPAKLKHMNTMLSPGENIAGRMQAGPWVISVESAVEGANIARDSEKFDAYIADKRAGDEIRRKTDADLRASRRQRDLDKEESDRRNREQRATAKAKRKKEREARRAHEPIRIRYGDARYDASMDAMPSPRNAFQENTINQMIQEELEAVLENVPNLDFQRRAHGGKTCDEWSQEISEFKALLQDARDTYDNLGYDLRQKVEDGDDTGGAYEAYLESGADVVEKAEVALKNAQTAAKRQKCQVATSPRRQPKRSKNKALELLKTIGDDLKNWPRDVAKILNYYYGDGR